MCVRVCVFIQLKLKWSIDVDVCILLWCFRNGTEAIQVKRYYFKKSHTFTAENSQTLSHCMMYRLEAWGSWYVWTITQHYDIMAAGDSVLVYFFFFFFSFSHCFCIESYILCFEFGDMLERKISNGVRKYRKKKHHSIARCKRLVLVFLAMT